jgi:RNA polymerase sigma-70 factor (ECF subfamily)
MEYDVPTDEALIEAANGDDASGFEAAFDALYYRYRDWVVRLAYRFTGDRDDALDALQETFTYLARKLPGLRLSARMTTFLYPVVKHTAIRIVRKRRRVLSDEEIPQETAAPSAPPQSSREELAAALRTLPDGQREVLLLRFVDGMRLGEIAQALRIKLGTVKSRLHNALSTLRNDKRTRRYFGL